MTEWTRDGKETMEKETEEITMNTTFQDITLFKYTHALCPGNEGQINA
jgi:hypothetical protein